MRALLLAGALAVAFGAAGSVANARVADDRQDAARQIEALLKTARYDTHLEQADIVHHKLGAARAEGESIYQQLDDVIRITDHMLANDPKWMGHDTNTEEVKFDLQHYLSLGVRRAENVVISPEAEKEMFRKMYEHFSADYAAAHRLAEPGCTVKSTFTPGSSSPPTKPFVHFYFQCPYNIRTVEVDTEGMPVDTCTVSAGTCSIVGGTHLIAKTAGGNGFIDATGSALQDGAGVVEDIIPLAGDSGPTIIDTVI